MIHSCSFHVAQGYLVMSFPLVSCSAPKLFIDFDSSLNDSIKSKIFQYNFPFLCSLVPVSINVCVSIAVYNGPLLCIFHSHQDIYSGNLWSFCLSLFKWVIFVMKYLVVENTESKKHLRHWPLNRFWDFNPSYLDCNVLSWNVLFWRTSLLQYLPECQYKSISFSACYFYNRPGTPKPIVYWITMTCFSVVSSNSLE